MKKKKENIVLVDTYYDNENYSYDAFTEFYKEMCPNCEVPDEDSNEYIQWENLEIKNDFADFSYNIEHLKVDGSVIVSGSLGLWNRNHDVYLTLIYNTKYYKNVLQEAIMKCIDNCDYFKVEYNPNDGCFEVSSSHHDGTNYFTINLLSKIGEKKMDKFDWEPVETELNPLWIKKFKYTIDDLFY